MYILIYEQEYNYDDLSTDIIKCSNNKASLEEYLLKLISKNKKEVKNWNTKQLKNQNIIYNYVNDNFDEIVKRGQRFAVVSKRDNDENLKRFLSLNHTFIFEILGKNDYIKLCDFTDYIPPLNKKYFKIIEIEEI